MSMAWFSKATTRPASITATVRNSVSAGNGGQGIFAVEAGAGTTTVMIDRSAAVSNEIGLFATGAGATIRIGNSTVSGNTQRGLLVSVSGLIPSYGTQQAERQRHRRRPHRHDRAEIERPAGRLVTALVAGNSLRRALRCICANGRGFGVSAPSEDCRALTSPRLCRRIARQCPAGPPVPALPFQPAKHIAPPYGEPCWHRLDRSSGRRSRNRAAPWREAALGRTLDFPFVLSLGPESTHYS